ncbi:hypothetical protein [Actomonas aquatica]|uniref:Transposase IS200-like domain-containing protein n=1 Tax=Actomonas aquatica TaxID=2866162 RepID=A0ABZ1C1V6_9BACT|nr:hypothetical protein [Opitutus sp. WL0086]WRQ85633.1 hypothetical protein K1X11_012545 [Opitutus sp. WL0086]
MATVHWTFVVERRATGWLNATFHARWREALLHACCRYELLCPIYVLMPDHTHLLLMGLNEQGSDQRTAIAFLRGHTKHALEPQTWQHQAHDHVLRPAERQRNAFAKACHYVAKNPVRQSLCDLATDWPYLGNVIPGYPDLPLRDNDHWDRFWRIRTKHLAAHDAPPTRSRS